MIASFFMQDMSWGWGVLMMIGWGALWALIIGLAVNLWRDRRAPSAQDLLDRRLAIGEISVAEHERLRRAIRGGAPPSF